MELHNLIVRVERSETASRMIDGDVADLLFMAPNGFKRAGGSQPDVWRDATGVARSPIWFAPRLTVHMDAAASVMPPGWRIRSLSDAQGSTRHRVILAKGDSEKTVVGYGCNRATAILAACLRAKALDRGSPMPKSHEFTSDPAHVVETEIHLIR